jgi:hypothetical protein
VILSPPLLVAAFGTASIPVFGIAKMRLFVVLVPPAVALFVVHSGDCITSSLEFASVV